jgi:hypothetical protein
MKTSGQFSRLIRIRLTVFIGLLFFARTGFSAPFIVGNGPDSTTIETYDFATGGPAVASFSPTGASIDGRGRGVEVVGDTVYYTAISGDIHVAPYNKGLGGAGYRRTSQPKDRLSQHRGQWHSGYRL